MPTQKKQLIPFEATHAGILILIKGELSARPELKQKVWLRH